MTRVDWAQVGSIVLWVTSCFFWYVEYHWTAGFVFVLFTLQSGVVKDMYDKEKP